VNKIDGYSQFITIPRPHRAGHLAQQCRGGEEDWLAAFFSASNLIHLPDKPAGVFGSLGCFS
jgi:hypothetical protein